MDLLKPVARTRNRALSVRSTTEAEREAMENSVAKLQDDIAMLETEWTRIITRDSNPLELALRFLDETSVGLHHRFNDFLQLKSQFAKDLQEVANDNYQAFNDSVASFSQTVDYITDAQDTLSDLKNGVNNSLQKLSIKDETLGDLNEDYMKQSNMISTLTAMEEVIKVNKDVENSLMNSDFVQAQEALSLGFTLAKEHNLWQLEVMKHIRDQLAGQEHSLFELLLEAITEIVYSKTTSHVEHDALLFSKTTTEESFNSLETYLHHIIHEDISEESYKKNQMLLDFLKNLGHIYSEDDAFAVTEETEYDKLYSHMKTLQAMNKLPLAIDLLLKRCKKEMKNIFTKCVEDLRLQHPSILKITTSLQNSSLGVSGQDILSVLIRRLFWEIFIKYLTAMQTHRALYEITKALQPPATSSVSYPFVEIWDTCLTIIKELIVGYIKDTQLSKSSKRRLRASSNLLKPKEQSENQLFSLQNNIEKDSSHGGRTSELKTMLADTFPGFNLSSTSTLDTIFLTEEKFEEEDTVIPPSVFNMRMILESLLVFVQGSAELLPPSLEENTTPSADFFIDLMKTEFLPQLNLTMAYLYESQVEFNPPFAVETLFNGTTILKSAVDFKTLYFRLLQTTNAANFYRENVATSLVSIIDKFYKYYYNIYQSICGTQNNVVSKKLISSWLTDDPTRTITSKVFEHDYDMIEAETNRLLNQIPKVFNNVHTLEKTDYFSDSTIDTLIYFATTLGWVGTWLPGLKKEVKDSTYADMLVKRKGITFAELRSTWSFFEVSDTEVLDKTGSIRFLLAGENLTRFDNMIGGLTNLHYLLLQSLRYDLRVRCLFHINRMFHSSKWNPEVTSIELDENISSLVSAISFLENKLKSAFADDHSMLVFIGISNFVNKALMTGAQSIAVLNVNGTKKLIRNVNALQQACKSATAGKDTEDLSKSVTFFGLCSMDEDAILTSFQKGELKGLTSDDVKSAIRLALSQELNRQMKRRSGTKQRVISMSATKRMQDALRKVDQFIDSN